MQINDQEEEKQDHEFQVRIGNEDQEKQRLLTQSDKALSPQLLSNKNIQPRQNAEMVQPNDVKIKYAEESTKPLALSQIADKQDPEEQIGEYQNSDYVEIWKKDHANQSDEIDELMREILDGQDVRFFDDGIGQVKQKVRELINKDFQVNRQKHEQKIKETPQSFLELALKLLNRYNKEKSSGKPEILKLRAEVYVRLKRYIQALNDMEEAAQLDQSEQFEPAKSCEQHYTITKSLMRMSNDI